MKNEAIYNSANENSSAGFTIIELLIAMAIMAIGIMGFLFLQTQSVKGRTFAREMDRATTVARSQLEELRALDYDSSLLDDDDSDTGPTKYPSIGTTITIAGNDEKYDQISIGNFNYFYRYEVTTDRETETKFINLYIAWFIKEKNASTTNLVPHHLGAPLTIAVSAYK